MSLKDAVPCNEKLIEPRRAQRGDYWVLYNYVPMSMAIKCWESVTYTTHADYTFLDNLEPLLERWQAPISIAMHAPGTDFPATLDAIRYSRNCGSSLVSQLVTFHIFFSSKHVPKMVSIKTDNSDLSKSRPRFSDPSRKNHANLWYLMNFLSQYDGCIISLLLSPLSVSQRAITWSLMFIEFWMFQYELISYKYFIFAGK